MPYESFTRTPLRFHDISPPVIEITSQAGGRLARVRTSGNQEAQTDPSGRYAYRLEGDLAFLLQWRIRADGVLRPLFPPKVSAHSHPSALRFHPGGRSAYVSCSHGAICQYRVHFGALAPLNPLQVYADNNPSPIWFDGTGRFACVITPAVENGYPRSDRLYIYGVGSDGGLALTRRIEVRGAFSKVSRDAWAGAISSFTVSGDSLHR